VRLVALLVVVSACGSKPDDRAHEKDTTNAELAKLASLTAGSADLDARLANVERAIAEAKIAVATAKDEGERQTARMRLTNLVAERKVLEMQIYAVRPAPPLTPERVEELRQELVSVEAKIKDTEQRLAEAKTQADRDAAAQLLDALRSSKASKQRDIDRAK
jgi:hypothetical protein